MHVPHLVRLLNGVQGYQSRADQGVPDQTFVPQLHHQTRFQMIDLATGREKNTFAAQPAGGAVHLPVRMGYCTPFALLSFNFQVETEYTVNMPLLWVMGHF